MTDFWLKQNVTRECNFIGDCRDLEAPQLITWRGVWHMGNRLIVDGDEVSIIPISNDYLSARLTIRPHGGLIRLEAELKCEIPPFAGAKQKYHYMVGPGGNNDLIYVFATMWTNMKPAVLIQRFVVGGNYEDHRPITDKIIKYVAPATPLASYWRNEDGPEPGAALVIPTQDDEGSGYQPP